MAIPNCLRPAMLALYEKGTTADAIAKRYGYSPQAVRQVIVNLGGHIRTKEEVSALLHPLPTKKEIADRTQEVQDTWDERTRKIRAGEFEQRVETPICFTGQRRRSHHNNSTD